MGFKPPSASSSSPNILNQNLSDPFSKSFNKTADKFNNNLRCETSSSPKHIGLFRRLDSIFLEAIDHGLSTQCMKM
ncbi:hypothetical protein H5410_024947, partial [Solanum commersonii]